MTASGAGSRCGELLDYRRGGLAEERVYPPERDVSEEEPRIGVFVCHCGANIGRVVDVPSAVEYALTLPNVVYAQEQLFSCATNSAQEITDMIKEKGLNRVVVAACTPRTHEPLFRDTRSGSGDQPVLLRDGQYQGALFPGSTPKKKKKPQRRQRKLSESRSPEPAISSLCRNLSFPLTRQRW
jgi:hypothetical protein